jgi:hypothetical protein
LGVVATNKTKTVSHALKITIIFKSNICDLQMSKMNFFEQYFIILNINFSYLLFALTFHVTVEN